ncbi:MAG: LTA synthase family protein [Bacteroidales bacterium]|nr:LTA synthase family protein [Bacteroidales bacterium]
MKINFVKKDWTKSNFITIISFTLKQYLFWMLYFQLLRLIFLVYNWSEIGDSDFVEVIKAFWYAIYLDNSTTGYIMMFPIFVTIIKSLFQTNFFNHLLRVYHGLFIFIATSISIAELPLYDEWKVKINYKAISYLSRPNEVFQTASVTEVIFGFLSIAFIVFIAIWAFNRWIFPKTKMQRSFIASLAHLFLLPICFIWGIRGGLQEIPIHQADVYYSKNNFLNLVAVNSAWNLGSSIDKNHYFKNTNPFIFLSFKEAKFKVDSLYNVPKDTSIRVLNIKNKPNIVILLLESWSADCIKSLGGYDSITPNFDALAQEGILFTNVFGSGGLSDQGIAAVLSAQPALPEVIIVNQPDKFIKLPSISSDLKKQGYYTFFMFGGQLSYGNIKAYLMTKDFDKIIEGNDFPSKIPRGRLGIHDEYLLNFFADSLHMLRQPFFSMVFTLSSHNPYDMPYAEKFNWGGDAQKYINSMAYADSSLGVFFNKVKKMPFYKNTLFVLVSDHSHNSPKGWHPYAQQYRRIAMMLYGEPIKKEYRGYKVNLYCSQTDLAKTLMKQLGYACSNYRWSKDLFNPYSKSFCYYAYDAGFGWVSDSNYFAYLHEDKSLLFHQFASKADSINTLKTGKAYLQLLFQEYLDF